MEIAPGIYRIRCPFGSRVVFCHLVVGAERSVLVDTGMAFSPEQDIFPYMQNIGFDPAALDLVVLTHSDVDHQGGNDIIKRVAPKAQFACHSLDTPWIESAEALINGRYRQFEVRHGIGYGDEGNAATARDCQSLVTMDWRLQGGEQVRLSPGRYLTFIHTPGHTWGHTAVWDEQTGTLIASEAALWTSNLGLDGKPALPPTYCYIDTYETTLQRLLAMDIPTYSPAHWPVQRGPDVKTFLADSLNYCRETEDKLLDLLSEAPQPLALSEIIALLNDSLGTWPRAASIDLAFPLAGHLQRLLNRGLIVETMQAGRAVYKSV
jgi:glyoxylase-like metal-dependent hydrolase (beta-lactamase superfamily II)